MINNLSIIVYTHTNVSDVWPMFFGELKKYMPFLEVNVFCDNIPVGINSSHFEGHNFIFYNDSKDYPFYKQYCECLEKVKTDYVLTLFEDQILYDNVDENEIKRLLDFLSNSDHSFLRLIKTDIHTIIPIEGEDNIFINPTNQHYFFSMQPTIWKKEDLLEALYDSEINSIFEEMKVSHSLRALNKTGTYVYKGEEQIGKNHCASSTLPHNEVIARGKWISLYMDQLRGLFQEYDINPSIRGFV